MYRLVVVVLLLSAALLPAQEYGLYQMRDVWNSSHLNPGFFPRQEFIFSLPSVHTSLNAIGVNKERLFEYNSAENTNYLNLEGIISDLERDLVVKNSTIIDGLGLGGQIGGFFVSLSTSSVVDAEFTLPEALLRTIWEGTEKYLDQPLNIGPAADMIAYQKIGLGVSYEINPRLSAGVRINRLLGGASFVTDRSNLTLTQSSDIYQTTAEMDYRAFYYGAGQFNLLDQTIEGFENFGDALDEQGMEPEGGSGLRNYTNRNNGWSVDLGAEYLMGDRLTFSASLLNLGSIRWENATQQVDLTGTVNFEGVDAANLEDGEDFEVIPGIDTIGTFEATSNVAYTQALSPRTYLGANYQVLPFLDVGGLLYNEFFSGGTFTALSLSSRVSLMRILSLGGIYTLQNGTFNSFGANAALKLGPLQVFAIADNLSAVANPERLDGANFRAGLNLTFGRKKSDLKLAAARGLDVNIPEGISLPDESAVAENKTTPVEPAPIEENQQLSGAETDPMAAEEELESSSPESEPEREPLLAIEAPPEQEQLSKPSESDPEEYPANHPTNANAINLFPFRLELRDKDDLGLLEAATVDVYRIEQGGYFKLIRTDKASGGRVSLQLTAEKSPYQAVVKSSGYDSLVVDFRPERKSSLNQVVFLKQQADASYDTTDGPSGDRVEVPASDLPSVGIPEEEEVSSADLPPTQAGEANPSFESETLDTVTDQEKEPKVAELQQTPDLVQTETEEVAESNTTLSPPYLTYLLTQRTSLRAAPNAQSDVISRMQVDTELKLLEKTNKWWWKVSMGGWDGYVKAALLKLRE
jgi:hypothetical protein